MQGLINCLKEILVPEPQQPEVSPSLPPAVPGLGASRLTRVALGPGSPPWGGEFLETCLLRPRFLKP